MTFEEALKALKEGKKIRKKWWHAGSYIWLDEKNNLKNKNGSEISVSVDFDFMTDNVWEIYQEPVLDEVEKKYLSAVIKPFRDRVTCIIKYNNCERGEYLDIFINSYDKGSEDIEEIFLPYFKKGTMYKGMEDNKKYILEELGL